MVEKLLHANSDKIRDYTEVIENQIGFLISSIGLMTIIKIEKLLTHIFIHI